MCNFTGKNKLTMSCIESTVLILIIICIFVSVSCAVLPTIVYASEADAMYVWSDSVETSAVPNTTNAPNTNQANSDNQANALELTCGSAVLMEQETGKVLYEHNAHEKLRPASVTKVMSLLLIMEALDEGRITLEDKVPCSENAASMGGSQIWLDVTEELSVNDMLKAICVVSANDCVVAMAEYLAGSESAFVEQMNKKAQELGMNDTTFKNCHGIDEDGHVTSAYDIAIMSQELMKNHPSITNYTTIWMDSLRDGKSSLVNTNKLIRTYRGITGLKTGSTSLALYNLTATATRDDLSLIAVVMKGETSAKRFEEAQKLLDYGFNNYAYKKFANVGEVAGKVSVNKGIESTVNGVFARNSGSLIKRGKEGKINKEVNLSDDISAPIYKGEIIGKVTYSVEGEVLGYTDIVAEKDVSKTTFWNFMTNTYKNWFNLTRS